MHHYNGDFVFSFQTFLYLPLLQNLLDASGRWGVMDAKRWDAFLDWLSDSGLLTTNIQSRQERVSERASSARYGPCSTPLLWSFVQGSRQACRKLYRPESARGRRDLMLTR